ncbi:MULTISPECIES: phytanoyl-CoA dioxygenase family protein [unclassified Paenibacillus]|uniref:phytanoyl-CoA dioxygenase family protein n=1 Tax=unclassified Paenibacillus TaxID=185978 RepID=UPI002782FFED|nr:MULTISPECIES: phytanoyl-CoA dioxygenase family protein [unclassified Paenibacillus]MDQ0897043.1 ectoine hydroxylase-related dioxygenase (phytanoyl-CoA dioxygenase family) [Paenibacillus sp. V4I7]MDQ0916808.1 ectoine hydroxylase-related dioxygenase (phytanoyl-CoA dioxygenase family) [Paenibacillus sp. V4I5]
MSIPETNKRNELPSLEDNYELSAQQKESYQKNGHIALRQVASKSEIAAYEPVISHLVKELNKHDKPLEQRDTYGKAFIQISNLWEKSEAIQRFVLAKRFAKIAADLMGVNGVRIYHDQALFKEPHGGHTPWHQDQIYWPLDTDKTITMWMPLVPISQEVGSMTFASESHLMGYINKMVISDESHRTLAGYIEGKGFETMSHGAMEAGDATFHSGWTLHSAPGNPTDTMRKVMTVIYYADGIRVAEPDSKARENDLKAWFPGIQPGDLAATALNPLVYSREAN